jgi:hypothetical protein
MVSEFSAAGLERFQFVELLLEAFWVAACEFLVAASGIFCFAWRERGVSFVFVGEKWTELVGRKKRTCLF